MAYTKQEEAWEDLPSIATPISAEKLDGIEQGVADAHDLVATHEADPTGAHAASAIAFTPTGTIAATDVQAALAEVVAEGSAGYTPGGADVAVTDGGTGASTAATARANLGLVIGTNVQAHNAVLDATTASFTTADETKLDGIATVGTVGGPPVVVHKAANETVNNNATLQDDDDLLFPIDTAGTWVGEFVLFIAGDATADFRADIGVPAAATGRKAAMASRSTDTLLETYAATSPGTAATALGNRAGGGIVRLPFQVASGGTAGNVVLQWAQSTPVVADTTVLAGSHVIAYRVA